MSRTLPTPSAPIVLSEADADAIADLFARCADFFLFQDGEPPTHADAQALFGDVPPSKAPEDQTVLGWGKPQRLDALAAILRDYPQPGTWYLGLLIIDPAIRGQGLGRAIYVEIEAYAASNGANEMRLAVLEAHAAAGRFWQARGFSKVRRAGPHTFKSKTHDRIELHRVLSSSAA